MINPAFIFVLAWLGVLFLYSLGMTTNLVMPSLLGCFVLFLNLLSIIVIYPFVCGRVAKCKNIDFDSYLPQILKYLKFIFGVWLFGTGYEIYYSGGLPFFWSLLGVGKLYTEFGVPSLHGALNAFYLHIITIIFFVFLRYKKKWFLIIVLMLLLWPVLMLGRGILLSAILQMSCIYFYLNRLSVKRFFSLTLGSLFVVISFGVLGDMRQTANPFSYLVKDEYVDMFGSLPSGLLWFYVYLTAGLSNFFYNIDSLAANFQFGYSFSNMLPSVLRTFLGLDQRNDMLNFVDHNLNTSTIYAGFISDFGAIGGVFLVAFVQLVCCFVYSSLLKGKPWGVFAYSVCFQILAFSIFYDMFFLLPTLFQLAMCFFLYLYLNVRFFNNPVNMPSC